MVKNLPTKRLPQMVAAGTDIPAINIQRGRDHGVPDYNTCRRTFKLPPAKTFSDITPDQDVAATLKELYGNVNNIGVSRP
jgi:hypothetical protein